MLTLKQRRPAYSISRVFLQHCYFFSGSGPSIDPIQFPQQTPKNDTISAPSSVFDVLFGNASEQITGTAASLFSDDNPYKRKPPQPALISDVTDHTPNPENSVVDEKKRKRNKEKSLVLDSNSAIQVSEKKKKKKSGLNEKEGEEKEVILEVEAIGTKKSEEDDGVDTVGRERIDTTA